jgi:hypothetical protein
MLHVGDDFEPSNPCRLMMVLLHLLVAKTEQGVLDGLNWFWDELLACLAQIIYGMGESEMS